MFLRMFWVAFILLFFPNIAEPDTRSKEVGGYLKIFIKFNSLGGEFIDNWTDFMRGLCKKHPAEKGIGPGFVEPYWIGEPILVHVAMGGSGFTISEGGKWLHGITLVVTDMTTGKEVARYDMTTFDEVSSRRGKDGSYAPVISTDSLRGVRSYPSIIFSNLVGDLEVERLYRFEIERDSDFLGHIKPYPRCIGTPPKYVVLFKPRSKYEEARKLHRIGSRKHLYDRDFKGAERLFLRALQKVPKMPRALIGLFRVYENQKRYQEALHVLKKLKKVTAEIDAKGAKTIQKMDQIDRKIRRIREKISAGR